MQILAQLMPVVQVDQMQGTETLAVAVGLVVILALVVLVALLGMEEHLRAMVAVDLVGLVVEAEAADLTQAQEPSFTVVAAVVVLAYLEQGLLGLVGPVHLALVVAAVVVDRPAQMAVVLISAAALVVRMVVVAAEEELMVQ